MRHGETDWNAQGLSQGNVDVPLNPTGLAQARAAAARLRGRGIATLVASPLARARVTAEIVAEALGLPLRIDAALREVAFGTQEGRTMQPWFEDWIAGRFTPEGAESFAALRARAAGTLNRLLALPPPLLVVGHGAFFRALRAAMGLPADVRLPNAAPVRCVPSADGWFVAPA